MRPWLVEFGPLVIPTSARDDLGAIAVGLSTEEFVDKVWIKRDKAHGPVFPSHREDWPMKRQAAVYARIKWHRHVIEILRLSDAQIVDESGNPLVKYKYCQICQEVPTRIVGKGPELVNGPGLQLAHSL